ncbi:HCP-like protein [Whalleya microplaca]|nr:HCP-like protein [Whalleya microplaca]
MGLRDLLKKKNQLDEGYSADRETLDRLAGPEFTFIRSDTHTQEIIHPPSHPLHAGSGNDQYLTATKDSSSSSASAGSKPRRSLDVFRPRSRGNSTSSAHSGGDNVSQPRGEGHRRLSQRLHLSRTPSTSEYVPENLPQINVTLSAADGGPGGAAGGAGGAGAQVVDKDAYENQWEKRATMLAQANETARVRSPSNAALPSSPIPSAPPVLKLYSDDPSPPGYTTSANNGRTPDGVVSSKAIDEGIQEAIRLHEEGRLDQSTRLFGRLADPQGANNPLSQVLYGLALRHGWGCEPDPARAITYLSAAASNSAAVESLALQAGLRKGGAAKGELVLAIFELANCFRHGWGIPKDPVAAKQYYETAANLGDTDAMNEIAWCYLEGFGCKKDKFAAARYYRLAEENGNKTLGNTWIWKDKYNPGGKKK